MVRDILTRRRRELSEDDVQHDQNIFDDIWDEQSSAITFG